MATKDDNQFPGDPTFLGKKAEALSTLIEKQFHPIFKEAGIVIPVKSCSVLQFLAQQKSASAADIARSLDQSHQLIIQKIPGLIKLKLINCRDDPQDRRRKEYRLNAKGRRQVELLNAVTSNLGDAYQDLFNELGIDVFDAISKTIVSLTQVDLQTRLNRTRDHK